MLNYGEGSRSEASKEIFVILWKKIILNEIWEKTFFLFTFGEILKQIFGLLGEAGGPRKFDPARLAAGKSSFHLKY